MAPKRLQVLHELLPAARVMAFLVNPANAATTETTTREMSAAARTLGVELHVLNANIARDVEAAFTKAVGLRAGGMVVSGGPFFFSQTENLAARCLQHAMPTIYQFHRFTAAGGRSVTDRRLPTHTAWPASIPAAFSRATGRPICLCNRPTKVEFIINLRTAKALGINVPNTSDRARRRGDRIGVGCPLLAQSGREPVHCTCPLPAVNRT